MCITQLLPVRIISSVLTSAQTRPHAFFLYRTPTPPCYYRVLGFRTAAYHVVDSYACNTTLGSSLGSGPGPLQTFFLSVYVDVTNSPLSASYLLISLMSVAVKNSHPTLNLHNKNVFHAAHSLGERG